MQQLGEAPLPDLAEQAGIEGQAIGRQQGQHLLQIGPELAGQQAAIVQGLAPGAHLRGPMGGLQQVGG